jgi:hypothetical protein
MSGSPSRPPRRRLRFCRAELPARDAAAAVPDTSAPARNGGRALQKPCFAIVLFLIAGGCVQTGDFGRPRASLWNDVVLPETGAFAAHLRNEHVSRYVLTDDENELRDRAWRFLMPAHERSWFEAIIADLVRTRVLPVDLYPTDRTAYHRALMGESFRSPASRYRRVSEDAHADLKLIGPFAARAARVIAADRVRLGSLDHVRAIDDDQIHHALARVAENRCLIAWVGHETYGRLVAYRYALEHLVIEAPQGDAVGAERTLASLEAHRRVLDGLVGPALPGMVCPGPDAEASPVHATAGEADLAGEAQTIALKD